MRGGATLYRARGEWTSTALAERWLEATNDFPVGLPFATASVGGLVGSLQRRDYVDRTTAAVAARRASRDASSSLFGVQVGVGRDRDNVARTRGPFRADSVVPLNRFAQNGSYARAALDYERGQALSLATSAAGARVQLHYEAAAGDLNWQRATAAIRVHRSIGRLLVTQRGDIGIVFASGGIPPQQLFELGGSERLPGYRYKQFVGDRSALFGAGLEYPLPGFRRADRWTLRHRLPAFAPALATSIGGGWTELSSQRARDAALALGRGSAVLVSEATGRMRGTFGLGFTVLSGLVHAGAAVGLDRGARFRPAFGIGASF